MVVTVSVLRPDLIIKEQEPKVLAVGVGGGGERGGEGGWGGFFHSSIISFPLEDCQIYTEIPFQRAIKSKLTIQPVVFYAFMQSMQRN